MEIKYTCPLGSDCETAENNIITRCRWYVKLAGMDAQGNEVDEWDCAMSWDVILQLETSANITKGTATIDALRNEQATGHKQFMALATKRVELN